MSDFTDWGENQVASIIAGGSAAFQTDFEMALLYSAAEDSFVPLSGFPRVAAPRSLQTWSGTQGASSLTPSSGSSRAISNNVAFDFGEAPATATANAIGIYSGENPLAYVLMDSPMAINAGDSVVIGAGEVVLTIMNVGGATNFCTNKLLDLIFRGQAFTFPTTYSIGLFVRSPDESGGGTEAGGAGYARAQVQFGSPVGGVLKNAAQVQFPSPTGAWGTVEASGFFDGSGNLLFYSALPDAKTIAAGAGAPRFPAESIILEVQ